MKKCFLLYILFVFIFQFASGQATTLVRIEGNFYDQLSLQPLPFQSYGVEVLDSSGTQIWVQQVAYADSVGHYRFNVNLANLPDTLYGTLRFVDGCGTTFTFHFEVTNTFVAWPGTDFYVCPWEPFCAASWVYGNALGNTPVSFVNRSQQGATSYSWDFGDGDTSTAQHPTHTYAANGSYYACLTVTGPQGCTSTFCDTVRVGGPWPGPNTVALYYGDIRPGVRGLIAVTNGSAKPARYFFGSQNWNLTESFTNTIAYPFPGNGAPVPCVEVEFSDSSWAQACLSLIPTGTCQANFYTTPDTSGQFSLLVVDNSYGNQISYTWDFGDGATSTLAHPQHTYAGAGIYNLCVTIVDSGGFCTRTFCDSIAVSNKVSTPFSIKVVGALALAAPSPEPVQVQASVFPNPANSNFELQFSLPRPTALSLDVMDMQGRVLKHQDWGVTAAGEHRLGTDVQDLPAGMYLVCIRVGEKLETHKLLIQH